MDEDTNTTNSTVPETAPREYDHKPEASPILVTKPGTKQEPTVSDRLRDIQDVSLRFLATASNETLGACAVGLCASTYLVLGRIGLVLIGALGGIVLHATWEGQSSESTNGQTTIQESARRRKELSVEVARRVLDWRDSKQAATEEETSAVDKSESTVPSRTLDFSEFQPATSTALTNFTDAVIRDYVKWWYGPILPGEQSFPASCRQTLISFILSFSSRLSRKRNADPFLDFVANSTSIIIVFLQELSAALKASQRQDAAEAIRTYLQYAPDSNLANVLSKEQQERKLGLVADDILKNFLDSSSYDCPPVRTFLREVLAGLVLQMSITTCSKPEWINGWIVCLLEEGEPEIMNVIDAGVGDMKGTLKKAGNADPVTSTEEVKHQRRVSRAEDAMQEAMREAQRLNAMIAEDEVRRRRGLLSESEDAMSTATTDIGMATPTSSDSDHNRVDDQSMESSMVFDIEGNALPSTAPASSAPTPAKESSAFTNFDQLGSSPTVLQATNNPPPPAEVMLAIPLTLHNASIAIMDMGEGDDRVAMRQKPDGELWLQIEPASSRFPGWMVTRRYVDFEPLHETIRRIAVISGVPEFAQKYSALPYWKGQSRASLIRALEVYLKDALKYERLAESEAMKKFLEKEAGLEKAPASSKNVLEQGSAALENVGKNFINVLGQGSKNIAGGGKAVFGGVQGVFGAVATGVTGQKRTPSSRPSNSRTNTSISISSAPRVSHDIQRQNADDMSPRAPPLPARPSKLSMDQDRQSRSPSFEASRVGQSQESLHLPPPPSEMTEEYVPVKSATPSRPATLHTPSRPTTPSSLSRSEAVGGPQAEVALSLPQKSAKKDTPLTEEETRIAIELIFAIITELYSLSSAWTIRMSLLSAAKTFLLRPNNPQLESIRTLLQASVIEANFSDTGLATHINKMRENGLPTEEELKQWPPEPTANEKEQLRIKARKLLVEKGMPQALTSVMGAAASGEALGRVFDCLQVEEVSRGLIFALLLQAVRAATQ